MKEGKIGCERSRVRINRLLYRIRNCELYGKEWGYPTLIYCTGQRHRTHGISACERCGYLPREDENYL